MKKVFQIIVLLAMTTIEVPALRAQSPTITVFQGLTFGMSLGNTTNTVAPTDPTAAAFLIQVPGYTMSKYAYASINVSITLPYSLTAGGSHTMNVSYSTNSACWNTTNSFSGITYFGPSSGIYQHIYAHPAGELRNVLIDALRQGSSVDDELAAMKASIAANGK